ncbi:hypothetical protein HU200_017664 [Digitaria exilis]|uniref:Uncharacterized protein n=1 Tax=Digitaria exilis TaxID=1010633 RepID=A0A835F6G5_9POAL|nr:hypothetical protein HU200_017664 [Digitaria exilis]
MAAFRSLAGASQRSTSTTHSGSPPLIASSMSSLESLAASGSGGASSSSTTSPSPAPSPSAPATTALTLRRRLGPSVPPPGGDASARSSSGPSSAASARHAVLTSELFPWARNPVISTDGAGAGEASSLALSPPSPSPSSSSAGRECLADLPAEGGHGVLAVEARRDNERQRPGGRRRGYLEEEGQPRHAHPGRATAAGEGAFCNNNRVSRGSLRDKIDGSCIDTAITDWRKVEGTGVLGEIWKRRE